MTKTQKFDRIVLGIDPGTLNFGYAIIKQDGAKYTLLEKGVLKLQKITDQVLKNKRIYEWLQEMYDTYLFDEVATEQPVYGKDPQAMLKLGRVLGSTIAFCIGRDVSVTEYMPKSIKKAITGNGNASKQQVAAMVSNILRTPLETKTYDDTDAVAIALTHIFNLSGQAVMNSKKSWTKFLTDNPDRIIK